MPLRPKKVYKPCEIESWINMKKLYPKKHYLDTFYNIIDKLRCKKLGLKHKPLKMVTDIHRFQQQCFEEHDVGYYYIDNDNNHCYIYDTYYPKKNIKDIQKFLDMFQADCQIEHRKVNSDCENPYNGRMIIHRTNAYIIRVSDKTNFGPTIYLKDFLCQDVLSLIHTYLFKV